MPPMMIPKQKPGKSRPVDISQLLAGKPEIGAPVSENAAANAEPDAGGQNRRNLPLGVASRSGRWLRY